MLKRSKSVLWLFVLAALWPLTTWGEENFIPADLEGGRYYTFKETTQAGEKVAEVSFVNGKGEITSIIVLKQKSSPDAKRMNNDNEILTTYMDAMPFDFSFSGGTLDQLFDDLRKGYLRSFAKTPPALKNYATLVSKENIRFAGDQICSDFKFPPMQVRAISLNSIYDLLEVMVPGQSDVRGEYSSVIEIELGITPDQVVTDITEGEKLLTEVYLFSMHTNLLSMNDIFDKKFYPIKNKPDDSVHTSQTPTYQQVVASLEAAWMMGNKAVCAKVSYHEPTGLIMVYGLRSELKIADGVFAALMSKDSIAPKKTTLADIQAELIELRKILDPK